MRRVTACTLSLVAAAVAGTAAAASAFAISTWDLRVYDARNPGFLSGFVVSLTRLKNNHNQGRYVGL